MLTSPVLTLIFLLIILLIASIKILKEYVCWLTETSFVKPDKIDERIYNKESLYSSQSDDEENAGSKHVSRLHRRPGPHLRKQTQR